MAQQLNSDGFPIDIDDATFFAAERKASKASNKIKVRCMECGKGFQTTKDIPECPKCGGVDIDVR